MIVRRQILKIVAGLAVSAGAGPSFAFSQDEPFPVFSSDVEQVAYRFRRREVKYKSDEPPGTIIVDSHNMYLYYIQGEGRAIRYGVGVGREGADWSGEAIISRKAPWPKWTPTPEQLSKHPSYEKYKDGFPGGTDNPLGARAMYLSQNGVDTHFRIHGTPLPASIGHAISSGCIRMINVDVIDLYDRVKPGTRVIVLPAGKRGLFG